MRTFGILGVQLWGLLGVWGLYDFRASGLGFRGLGFRGLGFRVFWLGLFSWGLCFKTRPRVNLDLTV